MKMNYYAIRDIKSQTFNRPFVGLTLDQVKRSLYYSMSQESEFSRFPEDFELYLVGDFDDHTGVITGQTPTMICNCMEIKRSFERGEKNE